MDTSDTRTPPVERAPSLGTPGRGAFVGFSLETLVMFPIPVSMYARLAHRAEADARAGFGAAYEACARRTPGWIPRPAARRRPARQS